MNKFKSVFAVGLAVLMLSFGAFAELAHSTFGTTDVQQLTYGANPVWQVTNLDTVPVVVRFTQPSGNNLTFGLVAGQSYRLGSFEAYYQWTCKNGGRPSLNPSVIVEPTYANQGATFYCVQ